MKINQSVQILACSAVLFLATVLQAGAYSFSNGSRVQTFANPSLVVHATHSTSGTVVTTEAEGLRGTIASSSYYDGTYTWWYINWDNSYSGYSVDAYLEPVPTLTVTSPNGGENWTAGSTHMVTWTASGDASAINYQLVEYSTDGGSTYTPVSSALTPSTRSYSWTLPSGVSSTQAKVRLRAMDVYTYILAQDTSDGNFTITTAVVPVTLTLYVRNGSTSGPLLTGALVTGTDGAANSFSQYTGSGGYVTIPGTPGTWQFTASDAGFTTASWPSSVTVSESLTAYLIPVQTAPTISTSSPLPAGTQNTAYNQTLAATGGTTPYTWALYSGSLPSGLSLNSSGTISGTPTAATTANFTVQVTGGNGLSSTKALSLTINATATAPTITTGSPLPAGTVGTTYSQTFAATGGTTPYTWSLYSGSLPSGLSLSSGGVLNGTPSAAATASFTMKVTGNNGLSSTKSFSLTINAGGGTSQVLGIDVSAYQSSVSWPDVAASNRSFAFIKTSQGDNYEDPVFQQGQRMPLAAAALNNNVSAYHFADPDEYDNPDQYLKINPADPNSVNADAVAEADKFFSVAEAYLRAPYLQPALDLEDDLDEAGIGLGEGGFNMRSYISAPVWNWSQIATWVNDWTTELQAKELQAGVSGIKPILYMTRSWAAGLAPYLANNSNYELWIVADTVASDPVIPPPNYPGTPSWSPSIWPWVVEQYNQTGLDLPPGCWDALNPAISLSALEIVQSVGTAPTITTGSPLPAGTVGTSYSQTFAATGGTTPYTWSLYSGSLPSGLSLSSGGVLSGTPSAATTASFTVKVTGNNGLSSTTSFSLTINAGGGTTAVPPIPTLISPANGGSAAGTTVTVSWNSSTGATNYVCQISRDAAFSNPTTDLGFATTYVNWTGLPNDGSVWYWRVKAGNAAGWSSYSLPWSFINGSSGTANYSISLSASPSAGGTVGGGGTFASGSSRTVTATANGGYTFANWTESGSVVSSSASYTFTLNGNRTLVANFTQNAVNYTISLSASPSAGGTVIGNGTFASGSSRTVTATANGGYTFANWTESGSVVSSSASYTFTLNGNRTLVANFIAVTSGVTTLQNGVAVTGIAGAASSQKFYKITVPSGQSTLTISISGGSGDCDLYVRRGSQPTTSIYDYRPYTSGNNETVSVSSPASGDWYVMLNGYAAYSGMTLLASYSGPVTVNYTISLSASPSAGGTVIGNGTFPSGSSRTVTATAKSGYTFANWTQSGVVVYSSASYTFTLTGSRTLVANFTQNTVNCTISLSALPSAGGTVIGNGTFASSSSRTVTATAKSGYTFANWTESGVVVSSSASYTFTLNGNRTLVANFTQNTVNNYTIFLSASPSAGGTVIGNGTFASGSSRKVTATANSGYTFANWTESGVVVSSSASYTFTLTGSRNLVANFTAVTSGVTTLQNGVAATGIAGATGNQKFYKITVPSGQSMLSISISGGTGDCDLYVRRGSQPTTSIYDYRPYLGGNNETVSVSSPASGDWYVMLNGYSNYSGLTVVAAYTVPAAAFPDTVIKSKQSTSVYATSQNPFYRDGYAGQCTWYAYGRILELVGSGYLPSAVGDRMLAAFKVAGGRNAAQWPQKLGGNWYSSGKFAPLSGDRRKKGLLAVYPGPDSNGHVGFVEEISSDKRTFRMSEFNRLGTELYSSTWYYFDIAEGSPDASLGASNTTQRYYPSFYDVSNPNW